MVDIQIVLPLLLAADSTLFCDICYVDDNGDFICVTIRKPAFSTLGISSFWHKMMSLQMQLFLCDDDDDD